MTSLGRYGSIDWDRGVSAGLPQPPPEIRAHARVARLLAAMANQQPVEGLQDGGYRLLLKIDLADEFTNLITRQELAVYTEAGFEGAQTPNGPKPEDNRSLREEELALPEPLRQAFERLALEWRCMVCYAWEPEEPNGVEIIIEGYDPQGPIDDADEFLALVARKVSRWLDHSGTGLPGSML